MIRLATFGVLFVVGTLCLGCSSGNPFPTAKASGKVTFKGQPVANAAVVFTPQAAQGATMSGKSANGMTDASGAFVLSTYSEGDGAVVGKHRVSVSSDDANKPLPGKTPPNLVLEVKPGGNDFPIELVP